MKILSGISLLLIILVATTNLQAAGEFCGELRPRGQYGPFDYSNASHRKEKLPIVERAHFSQGTRNLIEGGRTVSEYAYDWVGGDIDYTLRAFPNHYPALEAMAKIGLREKNVKVLHAQYNVECYFERAIRFKPSDGMVRMIYANYLLKLVGRRADAMEQYQIAAQILPENASINYNLGLLYLKEKNYEEATEHAKKAYELGFPLDGLRNNLMKIGKWDGKVNEEVLDEATDNEEVLDETTENEEVLDKTTKNVDEETDIESQK
ncbi:MAG: tetratricopeptide repeat protein [Nitrosomonadales bacterium]|nr:MAG: tetratricopeptide repeat protein [Nitrosomonadales bacterium]